jgi:hypothetical protein
VMRKIARRESHPRFLRRQRDVLCDVMLSAGQCETWLTLHELGRMTGYGEASVSAQLRHLRKPEYGGFAVEKRCRAVDRVVRGQGSPVWEYQLSRQLRPDLPRRRTTKKGESASAKTAIGKKSGAMK